MLKYATSDAFCLQTILTAQHNAKREEEQVFEMNGNRQFNIDHPKPDGQNMKDGATVEQTDLQAEEQVPQSLWAESATTGKWLDDRSK